MTLTPQQLNNMTPKQHATRNEVINHVTNEVISQRAIDNAQLVSATVAEQREALINSFSDNHVSLCEHLTASFNAVNFGTDQRKQKVANAIKGHFARINKDQNLKLIASKYQFSIIEDVTLSAPDYEKALDVLAGYMTPAEVDSLRYAILDTIETRADRVETDKAYAYAVAIRQQEKAARSFLKGLDIPLTAQSMSTARMAVNQ